MKLSIKKAYVARFYDVLVDGNNIKLLIDENTTEHCYCLIDEEKREAIDIEKRCVYRILERNNNGMIIPEEANNIELETPYVLEMQNIKWEELGPIGKERLCLKALPLIVDYRNKEKKSQKVKVLTGKDSKNK